MSFKRDSVILSMLYPFWGFIALLFTGNVRKYYLPVLLFFVFYGLTFVVAEFGDGRSHFLLFEKFQAMGWGSFFVEVQNVLLLRSDKYSDLYVLVINFLVSRVTSSSYIYFFVHSFLYGLVLLKGLLLFTKNIDVRSNFLAHVFFILLFMVAPIAKIQYVRFFFATWMFVVGLYLYYIENKRGGLLYLFGSLLIHFSFIIPLVLIPIYGLTKNKLLLWFIVAIIAFGSNNVLRNYSSRIVEGSSLIFSGEGKIGENTKAYAGNAGYIESREHRFDSRRWYTRAGFFLANAYTFLMLIICVNILFFNKLKDQSLVWLLTLSLFFYSLSEFGFAFASVGERFQQVYLLISSGFFMRYFALVNNPNMKKVSMIIIFPGLLFVVMAFREMAFTGNIIAFFGNPLLLIFNEKASLLSVLGLGG